MAKHSSRTIIEEEDIELSDFSTDELAEELRRRGCEVVDASYEPSTAASVRNMDQLRAWRVAEATPKPVQPRVWRPLEMWI